MYYLNLRQCLRVHDKFQFILLIHKSIEILKVIDTETDASVRISFRIVWDVLIFFFEIEGIYLKLENKQFSSLKTFWFSFRRLS